jgi:hypothetical protein
MMRRVFPLLILTLFLTAGCSKASEGDCDRAYERLVELRTAGEPAEVIKVQRAKLESDRPAFLGGCVGKVDQAVIRCWLKAESEEQLELCD